MFVSSTTSVPDRAEPISTPASEEEQVWAGDLPEDVPEFASPYDAETGPPPAAEALPVTVNPLQELVQRMTAVPVVAPIVQAIVARPSGAITTEQMIANARSLLGVRYVWGGNTTAGMDCSAYVSRVWGVSRQSTDTLHTVGYRIEKEELRAGDVLNLTRRQDPRGYGHVRVFERWANAQQTRMWVYEETPPRAIYHAIPYDPRYTPMRRNNYYPEETAELIQAMQAAEEVEDQLLAMVHRSLVGPPPSARPNTTSAPSQRVTNGSSVSAPKPAEDKESSGPAPQVKATEKPRSQTSPTRTPSTPTKTPPPRSTSTPRSETAGTIPTPRPATAVPTQVPTEIPATATPRPAPTLTPTPAGPPPLAPIRVTGVVQACREVLITWDYQGAGASGVRIYRDGKFLAGVSTESRYYVDSATQLDSNYRYTVTTWNPGGESSAPAVEVRTRPPSERCK